MRNKIFLVLQIDDNHIKAGLIENSKGNISVGDISSFPKNKKEIESGLTRLHGYRLYRKNTIVLIPPKKVMIRYLDLPSQDRAEIKDMINFQLPRYLPYNFGDIIFDFKIVQEKQEGYAKVMVACIKKELFREILESIPHLRDTLYGISLSGEVCIDLLNASRKDKKDAQALVDISSEGVAFSIFDSGGVLFMRSLDPAFFIQEKDWLKGFEELEKTFIAFGREFNEKKVGAITITGAKAYTLNFYNFLNKHSHMSIEVFNPFERIRCRKDIIEKFFTLSFHSIIGAAVIEKRHINLISPEFLSKKEKQVKKRNRIHIFSLTVVILFQLLFVLYKEVDKKKVHLNYLLSEIKKTRPEAKAIEDKEKRASLIKAQFNMEGSSLDILREVYRIIPSNISINILIFEKGNSLNIRGTARTMAEVFNLISQLEKSPYFDKIISEGTKMRKVKGEVMADFQIRGVLKK